MYILEDKGYKAKMLCDSISPDGVRFSTMEVTIPRIVLAEFNTHRMLSRNSASSRAIPVEKQLKKVTEDPFIPFYWGKNQKGMQADTELDLDQQELAIDIWKTARDKAIESATALMKLGIHKQIANRLLEPFLWQTIIVSATEWNNLFSLRCHRDAQPEIRKPVELMRDVLAISKPVELKHSEWHLPLIQPDEMNWSLDHYNYTKEETVEFWKKVSVGRCARISYLTHDGIRDPEADVNLCDSLRVSGHMSPFEHVARPMDSNSLPFLGNVRGWVQYRKELPFEYDYSKIVSS